MSAAASTRTGRDIYLSPALFTAQKTPALNAPKAPILGRYTLCSKMRSFMGRNEDSTELVIKNQRTPDEATIPSPFLDLSDLKKTSNEKTIRDSRNRKEARTPGSKMERDRGQSYKSVWPVGRKRSLM